MTEREATTALGEPAGKGRQSDRPKASQCVYGSKGALIVTAVPQDGPGLYETSHNAVAVSPPDSWSDLTGVGDTGFESHGGQQASVTFLKGGTLVSVILRGSNPTAPTAAAIAAARAAAGRL